MKKMNTIDLFAGCGGLMEGFEQNGNFRTIACVEWEKAPSDNLKNRLKTKWLHTNSENEVIRFDIQRTDELFLGFNDETYGIHLGMDKLIGKEKIDVIIGGPPCQAYSLAGRIRDENGMKDDYRNYLFESYIKVVERYKPSFFVFENVQGILSAQPGGIPIIQVIGESFSKIGYEILDNFENALFQLSDYGVPQQRKRIIILGVRKDQYPEVSKRMLSDFYFNVMPSFKTNKVTVRETINKYPALYPLDNPVVFKGKKISHTIYKGDKYYNHISRFHNERDIMIFKLLAKDAESGKNYYQNTEKLKRLYSTITGRHSNIHKYHVLRYDEQSNTIPAHLYKDGLRHIHPDSQQARSITVREAAALQTFPDDYEFVSSMTNQFKMIGNAVPPKFSKIIADSIAILSKRYKKK